MRLMNGKAMICHQILNEAIYKESMKIHHGNLSDEQPLSDWGAEILSYKRKFDLLWDPLKDR